MSVTLKAKQRQDLRQSTTKQLREDGQIPSVVYGKGTEAETIYVDRVELMKTIRDEGRNAIIKLEIEDGKTVDVMLQEYQTHPIRDLILHADFYKVDLSEEIDVEVSLRLIGDAEGEREGGIVQQPLYEVQVRAKPNNIPDEITVDISELEIGDTLLISDLPTSDEYEILDDQDAAIAIVSPPEAEEDLDAEPTDSSVEPELVGADDEEESETE